MGEGFITVIKNWPKPKNTKNVERFLSLANYHRSFIKNLYQLTGKQSLCGRKLSRKIFNFGFDNSTGPDDTQ